MKTMTRHIAALAVALCAGAAFSAESESYKLKFVPRLTGKGLYAMISVNL